MREGESVRGRIKKTPDYGQDFEAAQQGGQTDLGRLSLHRQRAHTFEAMTGLSGTKRKAAQDAFEAVKRNRIDEALDMSDGKCCCRLRP